MKNWTITIEYQGKELDIVIQAPYYSDAYVNAELKYPGCTIKRIAELRPEKEQ